MAESIILVPGLFGFARISDVDYFASVAPILREQTGIDPVPLVTPPTGSLWRRVDTLYRCVLKEIARLKDIDKNKSPRVHIVGHSTGGVDARLLVDPRYLWPGGPSGAERVAFFDSIGAVVSLSGPHKGTPIARRLRGALEGTIPLVFLVSFLAKYDVQNTAERKALWTGLHRAALYARAAEALSAKPGKLYSAADASGLPRDTANDLITFLDEIMQDHPLIHELTPYAMDRLNETLPRDAKGTTAPLPVKYFITAAPPPSVHWSELRLKNGIDPVRRAFYTASYEETRLTENEFGALPDARWIGKPEGFETYARTAQDGVVPAASQSFDGKAEALVYGDHLDVVGHYPSARHGGETVFDSGADFDDARLEELWRAIGALMK